MKKKKILSILALLLLLMMTLTSCNNDAEVPENMKELSNQSHAYNFYVYKHWTTDEQNNQCAFYSTVDRSNVSMSSYIPDEDHTSVTDFYNDMKEKYTKDLSEFKIVEESSEAKLYKYNAYKIVYTFTFGGEKYKVMHILSLHSNLIYMFTYTSSETGFDSHLTEVEAMLSAITFEA